VETIVMTVRHASVSFSNGMVALRFFRNRDSFSFRWKFWIPFCYSRCNTEWHLALECWLPVRFAHFAPCKAVWRTLYGDYCDSQRNIEGEATAITGSQKHCILALANGVIEVYDLCSGSLASPRLVVSESISSLMWTQRRSS